jgi:hypothetical protein
MSEAIAEPKTEVPLNPVIPPTVTVPPVDGKAGTPPPAPAPAAPAAKDDKTILGGEPPKAVAGVPEKYADFVLPENMSLDKETIAKATAAFKELGLSQENAQKLVTIQAEYAKANEAAILESFNKQVAGWKEESTKMFGNDAEKEFGTAAKAIDRFGTPALKQVLNETGLGNHPEWVKFCNKIGKTISEDNRVEGMRLSKAKSDAEALYPNMGKKK